MLDVLGHEFLSAEAHAYLDEQRPCRCGSTSGSLLVRRLFVGKTKTLHLWLLCLGCGQFFGSSLKQPPHERLADYPMVADDGTGEEFANVSAAGERIPLRDKDWSGYDLNGRLYLAKASDSCWRHATLLDTGVLDDAELKKRLQLPPDFFGDLYATLYDVDPHEVLTQCAFNGLCVNDALADERFNGFKSVREARAAKEIRISHRLITHSEGRELIREKPRVLRNALLNGFGNNPVILVAPMQAGVGAFAVRPGGATVDWRLGFTLHAVRTATRPKGSIIWSDRLALDEETEAAALFACAVATERAP